MHSLLITEIWAIKAPAEASQEWWAGGGSAMSQDRPATLPSECGKAVVFNKFLESLERIFFVGVVLIPDSLLCGNII